MYVSSEYGLTKRSGNLFKKVLELEGVKANEVLHIGDNLRSDWFRPKLIGMKSLSSSTLSYGNMEFMNTSFLIIYGVLAVIWFIALNFLTFQKGTESVAVSRRLAGVIKRAIGFSGVGFCADEGDIDKRLRFLAHPIGFGVLAALSINAVRAMCAVVAGENAAGVGRKGLIVAIAFLVFWSIASEVLKKRIPGRHCNGIDIIGNLIGVGVGSAVSLGTVTAAML